MQSFNHLRIAGIALLLVGSTTWGRALAQDPHAGRYEPYTVAASSSAYLSLYFSHLYETPGNANALAAYNYGYYASYYAASTWNAGFNQFLNGTISWNDYRKELYTTYVYTYCTYVYAYVASLETSAVNTQNALIYAYWANYSAYLAYVSPPPGDGLTAELQALADQHNAARASYGLGALHVDWRLNAAAQGHAQWMAANNTMSHYESDGSSPLDRAVRQGYSGTTFGVGENVAYGYNSEADLFAAWMNSAEHRTNILDSAYQDIGLGVASASEGTRFWSVEFGYISN
jgi:uncharacterized protein YkwD